MLLSSALHSFAFHASPHSGNVPLSEGQHEEEELAIHDGKDPSFIGVLSVVALLTGIIFYTLNKYVPIPYTVMCLGFGLFLGEMMVWADGELGALGDSIHNWESLHPNTILVMFLPPIIFESASTINFHIFTKAFSQVLLLAVPGVLINVILIALIGYYIFPYDWDFQTSMAFGAILSATDPVAVVALLKELGAPVSLSIIIEGESLLNDGVAFVLFLFFLDGMRGGELSVAGFIGDFFYSSGVGGIVGYMICVMMTMLSSAFFEDKKLQIVLTIAGAFGTFFVAEGILEASGVLALVAFGLNYSYFRNGGISAESNEAVENLWEIWGFIGNTIIFVYSGLLIIFNLQRNKAAKEADIEAADWGYLVLLYVLLNVIRMVSIVILYPLLQRLGYGMNPKWAAVMSWGGLRGAIGLTLGLVLATDKAISDEISMKVVFFISGIVVCTILINGTTTGTIVRKLGLTRRSKAAKTFYYKAISLLSKHIMDTITCLQRGGRYGGADWDRVWKNLPILSKEMQTKVENEIGKQLPGQHDRQMSNRFESVIHLDNMYELVDDGVTSMLLSDARSRFLNLIKSSYYKDFEHGAVTSKGYITILLNSATAAQEKVEGCLCDWDHLEGHCTLPQWYSKIHVHFVQHLLFAHRISIGYQIAMAFVHAHESVEDTFRELVSNEAIVDTILGESRDEIDMARALLVQYEQIYPDITRTVKTRQVTELVLNELQSFSEDLLREGEIEGSELQSIENALHKGRSNMWLWFFKTSDIEEKKNIFYHCELFIDMAKNEIDRFLDRSVEKVFSMDEIIQSPGEEVTGLYIIISGSVEMKYDGRTSHLTFGDVINAFGCVTKRTPNLTLRAMTDVTAYFITRPVVQKELESAQEDNNFERNVFFRAAVESIKVESDPRMHNLMANMKNIATVMNESQVVRPLNHKPTAPLGGLGILFSGELYRKGECVLSPALQPIKSFDLDEDCYFRNSALYVWIPPTVTWMQDSVHQVTPSMRRQMSTVLTRGKSNPSMVRARSSKFSTSSASATSV